MLVKSAAISMLFCTCICDMAHIPLILFLSWGLCWWTASPPQPSSEVRRYLLENTDLNLIVKKKLNCTRVVPKRRGQCVLLIYLQERKRFLLLYKKHCFVFYRKSFIVIYLFIITMDTNKNHMSLVVGAQTSSLSMKSFVYWSQDHKQLWIHVYLYKM
jgi:hypothetical protein